MGNQPSHPNESKINVQLDQKQYKEFLDYQKNKFNNQNVQPQLSERQSQPIQRQSQPMQRQSQPIQRQSQPIQRQSQPMQRQSHPIQRQSQPMQRQSQPMQRQSQPMQRQSQSVQKSFQYATSLKTSNSMQHSNTIQTPMNTSLSSIQNKSLNIPIQELPASTRQNSVSNIQSNHDHSNSNMLDRYNQETFHRSTNSKCNNEYQPRINLPKIQQTDKFKIENSFQNKYQSRNECLKSDNTSYGDQSKNKYDPYEVLSVSKNCTMSEATSVYKKLAKKAHPDRGGNSEVFDILTKSYLFIVDEIKKKMDKNHQELKENTEEYSFNKPEGEFDINQFNTLYKKFKLSDSNDNGYGNMMEKSKAVRDDFNIDNVFSDNFNISVFNTVFDNVKDESEQDKTLTVYKEPEAIVPNQSIGYSNIDDMNVNDYGKSAQLNQSNQLQYTDYKKAHTQQLINTQTFKKKTYRNIDELEKERDNTTFTMTDEERLYYDNKKKQKEIEEYHRKQSIQNRDNKIKSQFQKINQKMIHFRK